MAVKSDHYNVYIDFVRRTLAPVTRLNEAVANDIERLAKFQYGLAGEFLQLVLDQMRAAVHARDPGGFLARQSELGSHFIETMTARQQSFARLATEAQAGLAQWFEQTISPPEQAS